ncbi:MAG: hypothetical protein KGM43_10665 [Planctomycetota bacterium]|nr:hypothetical protein [Planctomycetota bacterium]
MSIASRAGAITSIVFRTSRRRLGTALFAFACGASAWFLYDPSAPRVVASWDRRFEDAVAEFTPDGSRFVLPDEKGATVRDASDGKELVRLEAIRRPDRVSVLLPTPAKSDERDSFAMNGDDLVPTALAACLGGLVGFTIERLWTRRRRSK